MHHLASFYRFAPLPDPAAARESVAAACAAAGVTGTVLLAPEGVNGTLAGTAGGVAAALAVLRALPGCADMPVRRAVSKAPPFGRLRLRVKREIVTMGRAGAGALAGTARRVAPGDWGAVLHDPGTVAVDVRNGFEVAIGSFAGAEDPGLASFRGFPGWWAANRSRLAGRRVAAFCTGGIRCEKATALMLAEGARDAVQLDGGILGYLAAVPAAASLWRGGCFVFDGRVSVGHGLVPDGHGLCHACRRPLSPADMGRAAYEPGVACHRCADARGPADRARFRERARQEALARARGARHLGRTDAR